ncbi:MAG TPA: WG repeat-containing protein [Chitinophagaceae bacterium]|nr:WG repeat-containing protein [Chitinophagaceae bacterium]
MSKSAIPLIVVIIFAACKGQQQAGEPASMAFERARINLEALFNEVDSFSAEGIARASLKDSSTYIDSSGKLLIPYKYNVQTFREGLGLVEEGEDGPFYYIDKTGKKILDLPGYTNAFSFVDGYAVVANKDGKYGMIDKTGREVIPCMYEEGPRNITGNMYIVWPVDGEKKVINIKGGPALPVTNFKELYYDEANNKYALSNDSGWYLLDDKGAVIKKLDVDGVFYPHDGAYIVNKTTEGKGTQYGVMDGNGNLVVPYGKYDNIEQWSEGLACVGVETGTSPNKEMTGVTDIHQKIGYVDKTGKEVIAPQFEDLMQSFNEGYAVAMQKGKIGYIDKTGQWIIQPQFDKAYPFSHGFAKVIIGDNSFYIDKKGNKMF